MINDKSRIVKEAEEYLGRKLTEVEILLVERSYCSGFIDGCKFERSELQF